MPVRLSFPSATHCAATLTAIAAADSMDTRSMAHPAFQNIKRALTSFSDYHAVDELHHAVYAALRLLSPTPLNKTHALIVSLNFHPMETDSSLSLSVDKAEVLPIDELIDTYLVSLAHDSVT